jgi:hypothetical protein
MSRTFGSYRIIAGARLTITIKGEVVIEYPNELEAISVRINLNMTSVDEIKSVADLISIATGFVLEIVACGGVPYSMTFVMTPLCEFCEYCKVQIGDEYECANLECRDTQTPPPHKSKDYIPKNCS